MTTKQIGLIKHLAKGHYGQILDTCIDGSVGLRGEDADLARMILSVIDNNGGRYADRIGNSRVSQMIEFLKSLPEPEPTVIVYPDDTPPSRVFTISVGHAAHEPVIEIAADRVDEAFAQARQQHPGKFLVCTGSKRPWA